jgi:hypothetical protein
LKIISNVAVVESKVWDHFDRPEDGYAKCKICQKSYSSGNSTSNLHKHLATHGIIVPKIPKKTSTRKNTAASSRPNAASTTQSSTTRSGRRQLASLSKSEKDSIDLLLVSLLCRDYLPFLLVESPRFIAFVRALNSVYRMPSRKTISSQLLPELAKKLEEKIKIFIGKASDICLTSDSWSSKATEHYIAITAHFFDDDFKLLSMSIGVHKMDKLDTSAHVDAITSVLEEFPGLREKIRLFVTDGASVMKSTACALGFQWFHCFAHRLNLVVQDNLKNEDLKNFLQRVRNIASHFKRSHKSLAALHRNLLRCNLPKLSLIRDVETRLVFLFVKWLSSTWFSFFSRWSSTYNMLDRFLNLKTAIHMTIVEENLRFDTMSHIECDQLEHIRYLLQPFAVVTGELSAESYVHASQVIHKLVLCKLLELIFHKQSYR